MPTLVAALTLAALLKMAHVDMPRWHLAFWYAVLVAAALNGALPRWHLLANGVGSFLAAWLYFSLLQHTDNRTDRALHWLVLVVGFVALLGSRFWLDVRQYTIGL